MGWGGLGSITGGVFGGILGNSADAQGRAADKQVAAINHATDIQNEQFKQTRADNMPALEARNSSLQRMRELLGIGGDTTASDYGSLAGAINPGDVTKEDGYQFGLNQGLTSLNNQMGARGMRNSGAALKAATRYGTDYATTKYDNAFNRVIANRNAQLNPLQSVAGAGQTGASTIAQAGQNYANNASENALQIGNVGAAKSIGTANIWQGAANQIIGAGLNYLGGGR